MRRARPVAVVLVAVVLIAVGASLAVVETASSPSPAKVRLTAFARVGILGNSGATTVTPSPKQTEAIWREMDMLPSVPFAGYS